METGFSSAKGPRWSEETSPFPFEFEIVAGRKRVVHREGRDQDETAPFPREFEIVARRTRQSQDETSPFLLEFKVVLPNGEAAFVRTARPPRTRRSARPAPKTLPRLKWHGVDASVELREYAARIASGEALPAFRGPILADGSSPSLRSERPAPMAPQPVPADSKAFARFGLALIVMSALVLASAVLGDDAQLRDIGQAISRWFR